MAHHIKAGIIGGAGYTGGEMIRLLINHPDVNIAYIQSRSNAGNSVSQVHPDLIGETNLKFSAEFHTDIDILFLCVGHGEARKFLEAHDIPDRVRMVDLSQDFRLPAHASFKGLDFVYGLPELNREQISNARSVANPGCFATAIQLGLLPLAEAGLLDEIYTTGITGSTGAGQALSATSHFSWRANNIQAYKSLTHQHLHEIGATLARLNRGKLPVLNFIPWRGDFTRGIFVSSQMHCERKESEIAELFETYYRDQPFTHIGNEPIFLKQVVNTNKCIIQIEKVGTILVVHSMIDNLLKGASGQAVQNMNIMFGLDETAGLKLKASYF